VLTTLLDLLAIVLIAGFGWFVWPPLVLLILGVCFLLVSRRATAPARGDEK
jgi:hypothetical protein